MRFLRKKKNGVMIDVVYKVGVGIVNLVLVMFGVGFLCEIIGKFIGWYVFVGIGIIVKLMFVFVIGVGIVY